MSLDGETHAHSHAHKTGHNWVDLVVAFSALFVSVVSLGVAIMHGNTMDRLVSANSWPMLQFDWGSAVVPGSLAMGVNNSGVGPAKIESAELLWKGAAYRTDTEFLRACCGLEPGPPKGLTGSLVPNRVVRAGERITFLTVDWSANPKVANALGQTLARRDVKLVICYCSIFGECWKDDLSTYSLNPPQVRACAQPAKPFDQGLLARPD
jgi:hypothetical protein